MQHHRRFSRTIRVTHLGFLADLCRVVCEMSRHLAEELPPLHIAPDVQKILESGTRKPFYSSADEAKEIEPDGPGILAEFPFLSGGKSSSPPSAILKLRVGAAGSRYELFETIFSSFPSCCCFRAICACAPVCKSQRW